MKEIITDIEGRKYTKPTLDHLTHGFGKPKEVQNQFLQSLGKPHLDSFNNLISNGLNLIVQHLDKIQISLPNDRILSIYISDLKLLEPVNEYNKPVYPSECRQSSCTYSGKLMGIVNWSINGEKTVPVVRDFGEMPIMVKSNKCHLKNLTPKQLIQHGEHEDEWGGYFIIKGHERVIRMLQHTRRNYPIAVRRKKWKGRGQMFSDKGVMLRSVADDETSANNVLHFVEDGTAKLMFFHSKSIYFVSLCLILKCLLNVSDVYIFRQMIQGYEDDIYFRSCVRKMLQRLVTEGITTHQVAKSYIGKMFRVKFPGTPSSVTDSEICDSLLRNCIAIHLKKYEDKFNLLVFMAQKLYSFVQSKCCAEGTDGVMVQEVLTAGSVFQQVLKDKLFTYLLSLKSAVMKKLSSGEAIQLSQRELAIICGKASTVGKSLESFLKTGNITTRFSGILPQDTGYSIIAENINRMRYMSHFKSIHRGAAFTEMRTTEARALLPDAWGFICPVHTPDGTPCGLLNHLSKDCEVTDAPNTDLVNNIPRKLYDLGVVPFSHFTPMSDSYTVLLDGRIVGRLPAECSSEVVAALRVLKVEGKEIPQTLEIVLVPKKEINSQFAGLYLFSGPGRLIRPVKNLLLNKNELIGTFEQVYMDICIKSSEAYSGRTTHQELSTTSFLSNLASLIPMPDCNQSPRNMYQCQMGKQSMGTPCHNWNVQADTKLYRLLFPSSPLFRPAHYDDIELDNFAMGINAVVAVISYTGYDMEDAIVINKSSYHRGFGHGSIVKSDFIELTAESYFERDPSVLDLEFHLDKDGLPFIGSTLEEGNPLYSYYDASEMKYIVKKYSSTEVAFIENVRVFEDVKKNKRACITLRIPRNPTVGDKFASRAGQKGICSQLWPTENLPFTDSGMVPDIVFNPHGFPSRMTIAMMLELMAGKSAAVEGKVYDATAFQFSQDHTAIDYFGKMLEAAGYSYYGTEKMYSGIDGREMEAEIFFGIVYYQRLRHMVLDKWQVRSTGPIDVITHQPVHGRKRGGGIRFGEMERDALISHGASALLNDRLLDCSDRYNALFCRKCCCLLSSTFEKCERSGEKIENCKKCLDGGDVCHIEIPYILRYFFVQLAAFNINVKILLSSQ